MYYLCTINCLKFIMFWKCHVSHCLFILISSFLCVLIIWYDIQCQNLNPFNILFFYLLLPDWWNCGNPYKIFIIIILLVQWQNATICSFNNRACNIFIQKPRDLNRKSLWMFNWIPVYQMHCVLCDNYKMLYGRLNLPVVALFIASDNSSNNSL